MSIPQGTYDIIQSTEQLLTGVSQSVKLQPNCTGYAIYNGGTDTLVLNGVILIVAGSFYGESVDGRCQLLEKVIELRSLTLGTEINAQLVQQLLVNRKAY